MDKVTVSVAFDGAGAKPMPPTSEPGTCEVPIPAGGHHAKVRITMSGFWEFEQGLVVTQSDPPTIAWDSPRELQSRSLEVHDRSGDFNLVYHAVVMQCRDARAKVEKVQQADPKKKIETLDPVARPIRDFDVSPVLHVGGLGWARFNQTVKRDVPDGKMFYIERPDIPKLVGVYVPKGVLQDLTTNGWKPASVPLNYHVNYHPPPPYGDEYPFGPRYVGLLFRYMLGYPAYALGAKAMVNQHHIAGKKWILVFPVGRSDKWFGTLPQQKNLLRLLQEVHHWMQRFVGLSLAMQPLGRVAISAFSKGADCLDQALSSTVSEFEANHLSEIYGFDPIPNGGVVASSDRMAAWLAADTAKRRLRIYTQQDKWRSQLKAKFSDLVESSGPDGTRECHSGCASVVVVPSPIWAAIRHDVPPKKDDKYPSFENSTDDYWKIHQIIPQLFMQHALKASNL
jgi:hypothetical protein